MGASASIVWTEVNEDLTVDEVKKILGTDFNQSQFDCEKNKETGLIARSTLQSIVGKHQTSSEKKNNSTPNKSPAKIGLQVPKVERRQQSRLRGRSFENETEEEKKSKTKSTTNKAFGRTLSHDSEPSKSSSKSGGAGINDADGHPEKDSWESVHQQPSCIVCGMLFTTLNKLEQHTKYSTLHVANLKRISELEKSKDETTQLFQEENNRCRALYTGNKYFWRTQDNLDINIYLHIDAKCVEVIAFEGKANFEYPRIYLDETKLLSMISENEIWARVDKVEAEEGKKKFKKELPPRNILFAEEKRLSTSSFILARLKIVMEEVKSLTSSSSDGNLLIEATKDLLNSQSAQMLKLGVVSSLNPAFGVKKLLYEAIPSDVVQDIHFNIQTSQVNITPVLIQRRRHSTDKEISDTIDSITEMQNDIRGMTEKAERIANAIHKGVENFNSKARIQSQLKKEYSTSRRRWIFAIKRVLRQGAVRKYTTLLLSYGGKYHTAPPKNYGLW